MEFTLRNSEQAIIACPVGRIDHASAETFAQSIAPLLENCQAGRPPLILDFSGVSYISSVGLRALMVAARQAKAQGGQLCIVSLQPLVSEVFTIARFNLVIPCFADSAEALQALA